jgi:hypothetical protein
MKKTQRRVRMGFSDEIEEHSTMSEKNNKGGTKEDEDRSDIKIEGVAKKNMKRVREEDKARSKKKIKRKIRR